jgi:hypothetical protein
MPEGDVDDLLNVFRWYHLLLSMFVFQGTLQELPGSAREHFGCIVNVITEGENIWIFSSFKISNLSSCLPTMW